MFAGLTLPLQQFASFSLQFCRSELKCTVLSIQLAAKLYEVVDFFFQRLNQVVGHGRYTV